MSYIGYEAKAQAGAIQPQGVQLERLGPNADLTDVHLGDQGSLESAAGAAAGASSSASAAAHQVATTPEEPEGVEAWLRYDETSDYKFHSNWATASQRGLAGRCKWAAYKVADGADRVGGFLANLFGLNESRYQYVIDAAERMEAQARAQAEEEAKQRETADNAEAAQVASLESGDSATPASSSAAAAAAANVTGEHVRGAPVDPEQRIAQPAAPV